MLAGGEHIKIIEICALSNGAHRNQATSGTIHVPTGWAIIPPEMPIPDTFPFVDIEVEDGVVVSMTAREVPEPGPEPEPEPTTEERVSALEEENTMLKAQVSAQSDQMDFYEECIAEMASIVYA